jgi:hypothetical protein
MKMICTYCAYFAHKLPLVMKVYFTASTAEFSKHRAQYWAIRDFLVAGGHTLTRDWLRETDSRIEGLEKKDLLDVKEIYKGCMKAIQEADLVVIDDTVSNFSTGHQITIALQRQKPTLVLWGAPKHKHFNQTFIQGLDSEYLMVGEYRKDEWMLLVRKFTKHFAGMSKRNRFHLVLSDPERRYLDWAQYNRGFSRNSLIRKALQQEVERDEEYQTYLAGKPNKFSIKLAKA